MEWACPVCTLSNPPATPACSACGTQAPATVATVVPPPALAGAGAASSGSLPRGRVSLSIKFKGVVGSVGLFVTMVEATAGGSWKVIATTETQDARGPEVPFSTKLFTDAPTAAAPMRLVLNRATGDVAEIGVYDCDLAALVAAGTSNVGLLPDVGVLSIEAVALPPVPYDAHFVFAASNLPSKRATHKSLSIFRETDSVPSEWAPVHTTPAVMANRCVAWPPVTVSAMALCGGDFLSRLLFEIVEDDGHGKTAVLSSGTATLERLTGSSDDSKPAPVLLGVPPTDRHAVGVVPAEPPRACAAPGCNVAHQNPGVDYCSAHKPMALPLSALSIVGAGASSPAAPTSVEDPHIVVHAFSFTKVAALDDPAPPPAIVLRSCLPPKLGAAPPPWMKDKEASRCVACSAPFKLTARRHHCRMCGACVCAPCAASHVDLTPYFVESTDEKGKPLSNARVCWSCVALVHALKAAAVPS